MIRCLALAGALVACTPTQEAVVENAAPVTPVSPATPSPSPSASPVARVALVIEGEGLRFVDPDSGRASPLAFGSPQDRTLTATTAALGTPADHGTNADCPAGPVAFARWASGFTLHFRAKAFIGWTGGTGITTMSGIGLGSTRKQLADAYDAKIEQTGLGTQFSAGGLTGVLASDAPDAKIQALWAGEGCVAG
jgi:hypothetical protein